jgi:hypothetical protein
MIVASATTKPPLMPNEAKLLYRGLVRRLRQLATHQPLAATESLSGSKQQPRLSPVSKHVRELFRIPPADAAHPTVSRIATAQLAHRLLQDLAQRQELYDMDRGADVQLSTPEWTRRAAARAGLLLPKPSSSSAE